MAKQKLVENFSIDTSEISKIPLTEDSSRVISEGKEYKCLSAYTFPISKPDQENFNKRVYFYSY